MHHDYGQQCSTWFSCDYHCTLEPHFRHDYGQQCSGGTP